MTNYRKHILTALLGVLLLYYGGDWLLENALQGPLSRRNTDTARLEKRIQEAKDDLAVARRAKRRLDTWRMQSLPSDAEVARSLYQAWLLKKVGQVELSSPSVDSSEPVSRRDYQSLSFTVRGRGTLEQLTKFLYDFYDAGHLHQIGSLGITPVPNTDDLDLSISIEALALYDATDQDGQPREDQLTTVRSDRLASDSLEDYDVIVERNIFGIGGSPDVTEYTYLTAVTQIDGRPVAWFNLRTSNEIQKLGEGEDLRIDRFSAKVAEIEGSDVILESGGGRWLLTIGDSLAEAYALPPEY